MTIPELISALQTKLLSGEVEADAQIIADYDGGFGGVAIDSVSVVDGNIHLSGYG